MLSQWPNSFSFQLNGGRYLNNVLNWHFVWHGQLVQQSTNDPKFKGLNPQGEKHKVGNESINNCLNTNIYSYLKTSGGQGSNPYLNVVHSLNTRAD